MKIFLNKIRNGNLAQKIVFTLWLIVSIFGILGISWSPASEQTGYLVFLIIESIIAYVLFTVWADKEK